MRLKNALAEIEYGQAPGNFEHVIVNDDLEIAFTQLCTAIGLVPPPLVVAGPSGVGKGTLIKKLQVRRPSWLAFPPAGRHAISAQACDVTHRDHAGRFPGQVRVFGVAHNTWAAAG